MEIRLHTARPLIEHKYPLYLNCIAQNKLQLSQVPVCKPPKNIFFKKTYKTIIRFINLIQLSVVNVSGELLKKYQICSVVAIFENWSKKKLKNLCFERIHFPSYNFFGNVFLFCFQVPELHFKNTLFPNPNRRLRFYFLSNQKEGKQIWNILSIKINNKAPNSPPKPTNFITSYQSSSL